MRQDLLEFTRGLDFGRYIKDAEVQSMIDQVKKRIMELEGQPEVDEEGVGDHDNSSDSDGSRGRESDVLDETEARLQVRFRILHHIPPVELPMDSGTPPSWPSVLK